MKIRNLLLFVLLAALIVTVAACGNEKPVDTTKAPVVTGGIEYPEDTSPIEVVITTGKDTPTRPEETTGTPQTTKEPTTTKTPTTTGTPVTTSPTPVTTAGYIVVTEAPQGETYKPEPIDNAAMAIGELALVSVHHPTNEKAVQAVEAALTTLKNIQGYEMRTNTMRMNELAAQALVDMCTALYSDLGMDYLLVQDAYRTPTEQSIEYDRYKSQNGAKGYYVLPAGSSDYQTGYAIRFKAYIGGKTYELNYSANATVKQLRNWMNANAMYFGFTLRYPADKTATTGINKEADLFHYRYVGTVHAMMMANYGVCLEEYTEMLKTFIGDNHLYVNTLNAAGQVNGQYEIYYVPAASGDTTTLQVPENYPYTVSGNNADGFIVTVDLTQK